ncbi:MAG: glycosyltransferase family 39 protein [Deltaproteobacteria bacterium]|nr:glycosyltransferase family 39 protein [Deltaproteobacteria bacterium]
MTAEQALTVSDRRIRLVCIVLILAFLALQAVLSMSRFINGDEGQHLYVLRSIDQGKLLYKDLFEHHGPLFYYLSSPLVALTESAEGLVTSFRILCLALWALALGLLFMLGRRLSGRGSDLSGWLSVLLWISCLFSYITAIEIRPEALHLPVILASLLLLLAAQKGGSMRLSAASGLLSGLSLLAGPRSLFVGVAFVAVLLLDIALAEPGQRAGSAKRMIAFGLAALAPVLGCILLFAAAGGLTEFLTCYLKYNLDYHYQSALPTLGFFSDSFFHNPEIWLLGAAGMARCFYRAPSRDWLSMSVVLAVGLLTLLVTPTASFQYMHGVILPYLALNGGALLDELLSLGRPRWAALLLGLVAGLLCLSCLYKPGFFSVSVLLRCPGPVIVPVVAGLGLVLCSALVFRPTRAPVFLVPLLLVWISFQTLAGFVAASGGRPFGQRQQLASIARIADLVPAGGSILDGFSGLVFMHPAYDHKWLLHDHAVDMFGRRRLQRHFRHRMAHDPPSVIIVDQFQRYLWRSLSGPGAAAPFYHQTDTDTLYSVCAQYRPAFSQVDQIIFTPALSQPEVTVFVHDPVEREVTELATRPDMRPHRSSDAGVELFYPDAIGRDASRFPVAVPLEPHFERGRLMATLRWRASASPACPVRCRWRWVCRFDAHIGRPSCTHERLASARCAGVREGRVLGELVRFDGDERLFALFWVPLSGDAVWVAFFIELANAAGVHRIRAGELDFAVRVRDGGNQ